MKNAARMGATRGRRVAGARELASTSETRPLCVSRAEARPLPSELRGGARRKQAVCRRRAFASLALRSARCLSAGSSERIRALASIRVRAQGSDEKGAGDEEVVVEAKVASEGGSASETEDDGEVARAGEAKSAQVGAGDDEEAPAPKVSEDPLLSSQDLGDLTLRVRDFVWPFGDRRRRRKLRRLRRSALASPNDEAKQAAYLRALLHVSPRAVVTKVDRGGFATGPQVVAEYLKALVYTKKIEDYARCARSSCRHDAPPPMSPSRPPLSLSLECHRLC